MHGVKFVFALSIFLASIFGAQVVKAENFTWNMRSEHPNTVELEFYAPDTGGSWPGDGEVYVLDDSDDHVFPLACEAGERICYGAWVQGDESTQWGTGPDGNQSCPDCCYICDGGESPLQVMSE